MVLFAKAFRDLVLLSLITPDCRRQHSLDAFLYLCMCVCAAQICPALKGHMAKCDLEVLEAGWNSLDDETLAALLACVARSRIRSALQTALRAYP